jgi:hypothetical protein
MPMEKNGSINISTAKTHVPEWYRKSEFFAHTNEGVEVPGLKTCIAVLDSFLSGYMLVLDVDIHINTKNNQFEFYKISEFDNIRSKPSFMKERAKDLNDFGSKIPRPAGHCDQQMIWDNNLGWGVPKGWSVLVTHPLNRFDLPFTTMSGIIDSDKWTAPGSIPFFIKDDIDIILPKGTPIAQLIPIKREEWNHKLMPKNYDKQTVNARSVSHGWYKKHVWKKKKYN